MFGRQDIISSSGLIWFLLGLIDLALRLRLLNLRFPEGTRTVLPVLPGGTSSQHSSASESEYSLSLWSLELEIFSALGPVRPGAELTRGWDFSKDFVSLSASESE